MKDKHCTPLSDICGRRGNRGHGLRCGFLRSKIAPPKAHAFRPRGRGITSVKMCITATATTSVHMRGIETALAVGTEQFRQRSRDIRTLLNTQPLVLCVIPPRNPSSSFS